MTEEIKVTFVIPKHYQNENECPEEMQLAFIVCEQHRGGGLQAQWVNESSWENFSGLTKRDVFVLQDFEGELYERLRTTKCLIVGPRCLSCCLTEGVPIPSGPEPVYTVAMRGLVITASGFTKPKKDNIRKKVQRMGGLYSTVLTDDTTHLVSDTVLSDKYIKSVEKGIPVMSESWVDAVWEKSLHLNVNGSSPDFCGHKLPVFANLQVTTSGIPKRDKQMVMKLVNENGGTFSGAFQSETTDIVVLTKEGVGSEKYKAALEYGKACVLPAWVKDSAMKGVALPLAQYRVAGASTSSPLAEHRLPDMSLNFSRITNLRPPSNFVDETRSTDVSTMSGKMKLSQEMSSKKSDTSMDKDVLAAFENFDMSDIKKAGPIFDGFCIWVCGLEGVYRERAAACVSRGGGVRYDCPHERVTHCVAGCHAAAVVARTRLPHAPVLSPLWLLIDVKPATPMKSSARKPRIEAASPMSKRNLQLLRRGPLDLPPPTVEVEEPVQDEIVNHYLSQPMPEPGLEPLKEKSEPEQPTTNTTNQRSDVTDFTQEPTEEIEQIFRGLKIEVQGLEEEAICEVGAEVGAAGGAVVAAGAGGTHVLVPLDFDRAELVTAGAEAVTVFWLKDCLSQQELVDIQYYHRPVKVAQWNDTPPLKGVVASLSTYSGIERAFLDELAKLLGATTQLRFCRRNTANALASTHLICPTPTGDKYLGAVKWGLPAVKATWLLQCAKEGKRVSEREYLVGDTKAPPSPEKPNKPIEEVTDTTVKDKENEMLPPIKAAVPRRLSVPSREGTPKSKNLDPEDMSPASRYIAMARQGLLGSDSQETPKRMQDLKEDAKQGAVQPQPGAAEPHHAAAAARAAPGGDALRPLDKNPDTPDSAFGAALRPGSGRLSPDARKRLWKFVNDLPSKEQTPKEKHTPLSEIRNRFLAQFNGESPVPTSEHTLAPRKLNLQEEADTPPAKMPKISAEQSAGGVSIVASEGGDRSSSSSMGAVDAQLQRLSAALSRCTPRARRNRDSTPVPVAPPETEPGPESQPNTVGWDDTTPAKIVEMIQYLGGEVSDGAELDPDVTHLLCAAPGRSEKMLGSIAAGKWVLHPAYVVRSRMHGKFLPEEEFEWGNPKASCLPQLSAAERILARAAHRWRGARARGLPGPFAGVAALLHVPPPRRHLLARLLAAGQGPYNDENITVCFADVKRYPLSDRDASWLISKRIPVCAPVLLSSYLTEDTPPNPVEHCLPDFRPK
ncbi:unnamed protein product [Diatraea saccharalis]|uniref:BRCT domain-containing protein n=1 Tax=Diatraea saccharalis TaxID=40085 RepID=A0A9N9N0H0_9NEOP|nr:unnamed protein product [Diatraea saccharalis]